LDWFEEVNIYGGGGHADRRGRWPLYVYANFRNLIEREIYGSDILKNDIGIDGRRRRGHWPFEFVI